MNAEQEAEEIIHRRWLEKWPRPEDHPQDAAFQAMAAFVHLFCALFNFGAFLYHARRVPRR